MAKTIIISITVIICTILLCSTVVYVNCIKLDSYTNYSIIGNGTMSDPLILKDLKTGNIYRRDNNGFWKLDVSFNN